MKKILSITVLLLVGTTITAQLKNSKLGTSNMGKTSLNQGIKVPNMTQLTTAQIGKLNLPTLKITERQLNARPLSSWKISPTKLKDTYLEMNQFFGFSSRAFWEIHSMPMLEGREVTRWQAGFLWLKFRQSQQVEYRMKVKLKGNNFRGQQIYAQVNDFSAKYPVDPNDGTVNITWTANRSTSNASIAIGQLMKPNGTQDQRIPFQATKVEYIKIDKISN